MPSEHLPQMNYKFFNSHQDQSCSNIALITKKETPLFDFDVFYYPIALDSLQELCSEWKLVLRNGIKKTHQEKCWQLFWRIYFILIKCLCIHSFKKNKQMFVYTQLRVPYNPFPYISYFTEQPFSSLLAAFFGIYLDFFH